MAACRSESGSGIVQLALAKLSPTAWAYQRPVARHANPYKPVGASSFAVVQSSYLCFRTSVLHCQTAGSLGQRRFADHCGTAVAGKPYPTARFSPCAQSR